MHPEHIKQLILAGMTCEQLALDGDGQHFEALLSSAPSLSARTASSASSM